MATLVGQTVSHYKILAHLGGGGMGVVYLAEDTRLKRKVALKFLPQGLEPHEPERARFVQEAQAASALNHPNVCTIYDIAEAEEDQFIVMEYVDGVTLRDKLAMGKLTLVAAAVYAIQIGEALEEAHGKGIVHRDIKAENIMVNTKGQAKVMDFGLAKLKGSLKLTKTSSTIGTVAYMAPEQIQGKEVDARSDIFSFGIVLYEMLTGHLPFRGDHEAALMYSILNEEPQPLQSHLPGAPSELVHLVNRALEKAPEERYQTVHDMLIDLRRLRKASDRVMGPTGVIPLAEQGAPPTEPHGAGRFPMWIRAVALGATVVSGVIAGWIIFRPGGDILGSGHTAGQNSIAVMYFENRTDEKELDKILVDMLITNLGRNKELSVVSGQRLFDILKSLGKQDDAVIDRSTASEVAKRAGARSMLLGSIWKVGGKLSVPAQLLNVESGEVINSHRIEVARAEEVFAIADLLTEKVSAWLHRSSGETLRVADATTGSYDAYTAYERGRRHVYRFEHPEAMRSFAEAVRLDSSFALAWYWLSIMQGFWRIVNVVPGEDLERARVSSSRAQQYARDLPEVDRQLIGSWHAALQRDTRATGEILLELVRKYPDSKTAWFHSALNKQVDGDFAEAARCLERTIELDRSYSDAYNQLAYAYCTIGDFEKGIAAVRTYIALIPDAWNAYDSGAEVLMMAGRFDEAQKVLDEGFRRIPTWYGSCRHRAVIHLINGEPEGAREKLALYERLDPSALENVDYHRSVSFLLEGRVEKAIELLHRNVERARSENKPVAEMSGRMYLARVLIERGRHDDALRELQAIKLISRDVHREGLNPWPVRCEYYAGLCLIMRGNIEEAEARVSEIRLTVDSTLRDPFYHLYGNGLKAAILLARGDAAGASASLGRIPGILRANFPRFRTLRAQIAAQLGDRSTALQLYNQTRNRVNIQTAGSGGDFFDFWIEHSKIDYYLGKAHEQFGEQANAIQSYRRALHRWKDADTGYPPFVDAKESLARLAR